MLHVQEEDLHSTTVYGSASARKAIPRYEMAEEELDPRLAKRFIADELQLVRPDCASEASLQGCFVKRRTRK
jgi:hypothetical protein